MKPELYSNNPIKSFVRQAADYEAAGIDPKVSVIAPFTAEDTRETIEEKGVDWAGLMRQANQVFVENIGGSYAAMARKAFSKNETPPGQAEVDALVLRYNFSGARTSSEAGMSEEERTFRSVLRLRLKALLREGTFSADGTTRLTVQTQREFSKGELLDNKISVEDFESLVEAAAEGAVFEYDNCEYDFSGDPEFEYNDNGVVSAYLNPAAITAHAKELAEAKLAADQSIRAVTASIPSN